MASRGRNVDELIVAALASGQTWAEAATAAGCSVRHVARRAADPTVREAVTQARASMLEKAIGQASDQLAGAVRVLADTMADQAVPPAVRVTAAVKMIDAALRLRVEMDTEQRLTRLEQLAQKYATDNGGNQ